MSSVTTTRPFADFFHKLKLTLSMIKVQHSVFALPFALISFLKATDGQPQILDLIFIVLAMITARNTAMSFNRIVDRKFDAHNPRTQSREIPSGQLSVSFSVAFCTVNALFFILISSYFNNLTLILSPIALMIVCGYSLTKRFTSFTQIFLGLSLGIAPIAAWIAATGTVNLFPCLLGVGVLFWVAGFDLIYSTMDHDYDKVNNLKNLVVKLGISRSLLLARFFHVASVMFFILAGLNLQLGWSYFLGCVFCAALMTYEHTLIKPDDLSRVNMAFFTLNGYMALGFLGFVLFDIYVA